MHCRTLVQHQEQSICSNTVAACMRRALQLMPNAVNSQHTGEKNKQNTQHCHDDPHRGLRSARQCRHARRHVAEPPIFFRGFDAKLTVTVTERGPSVFFLFFLFLFGPFASVEEEAKGTGRGPVWVPYWIGGAIAAEPKIVANMGLVHTVEAQDVHMLAFDVLPSN